MSAQPNRQPLQGCAINGLTETKTSEQNHGPDKKHAPRPRPNSTDNRRFSDRPLRVSRGSTFFSKQPKLLYRVAQGGRPTPRSRDWRQHPSSVNTIYIGRSSLGQSYWSATSDG